MVRFEASGWYSRLCLQGSLLSVFFLLLVPVHAQKRYLLPTHVVPQVVASGKASAVGLLPANQKMRVDIMLPLRNQAALNSLLKRLYGPSSPDYRHFLTPAEFTVQFGPTQADYSTVVQWARSKGLVVLGKDPGRQVVRISGTAARVENAFDVVLHAYKRQKGTGTYFAPDREPSVDLSTPLQYIGGLSSYEVPRPMLAHGSGVLSSAVGTGPGGALSGSDRRAAYYSADADPSTLLTGTGQSVALFEEGGYYTSVVRHK